MLGKTLGLLAVFVLWMGPQSPLSQPVQSPQRPTFRASTQLVEVDVNVTDSEGAFVPDLTLADFELTDGGKRRQIDLAYVVRSGHVSLAEGAAPPGGALPVVPPSGQRVLVFYFDTTHMTYGQLRRAGIAAEQFLEQDARADEIVGVVVGEQLLNNRLTADRRESLGALRAVSQASEEPTPVTAGGIADAGRSGEASGAASPSDAAAAEIADNLKDADKKIVSGRAGPAELTTLQMLDRLVQALAKVPGRKNVVYFSGGFPILGAMPGSKDPDELPALGRITGGAARSNVHIYSIDVAGLDKGVGSSRILDATEPEFSSAAAANSAHSRDPGKGDLLTDLALDTGGLIFVNRNYYADTLKQIDQDSRDYYVLAFRPDEKDKPKEGTFRTLHVSVHRPHVTVRARKGYVVH